MKRTYRLEVPELHYTVYEIDAESLEEAKRRVLDVGVEVSTEFDHTIDESEREWLLLADDGTRKVA